MNFFLLLVLFGLGNLLPCFADVINSIILFDVPDIIYDVLLASSCPNTKLFLFIGPSSQISTSGFLSSTSNVG